MMLNIDTSNALDELAARLDQSNTLKQLHADKWRRTYGRIDPGASASISLVYEKDGELPIRVNVGSQPHEGARPEAGIGWINSSTCMDDPVLPTLKPAYEAYRCEQIVRYRPGKRCTFRGQSAGRQAFIKVLADDRGDVIAQDSLALQTCRGSLDFDIADCLGWNDDLQALTHRAIPGVSVMPAILGGNAVGMAARIGAALGSLPLSPATPTATFTARDQIKRTSKYARKFSRAAPGVGPLIDAFVEALIRGHERTPILLRGRSTVHRTHINGLITAAVSHLSILTACRWGQSRLMPRHLWRSWILRRADSTPRSRPFSKPTRSVSAPSIID